MSEIDWPTGFDRTAPGDRARTSKFSSTIGKTTEAIATQMDRMDVDEWRASTGSGGAHVKGNGLPKATANPDDPGIAVYWTKNGDQYAVACDRWWRLVSNAREVLLWIEETRKRGDRPVVTGDAQFAAARLPSGKEDDPVVALDEKPHVILGVQPDAPENVVKAAARQAKASAHPDQGGSREEFQRVKAAEEAMLDE